jgi:predicted lipid-binding transport protein (Tim44 family)
MGAGIAGGFIGNMLFRSMGWGGGYGMGGMGGGGGGGFGIFEFLILLGVIFFLFKFLARKNLPESGYGNDSPNQPPRDYSGYSMSNNGTDREAANLMREARPNGWSGGNSSSPEVNRNEFQNTEDAGGTPIDRDQAMDLFFQVQGAWANRDLASASSILDTEAKTYLEEELFRLRALKQINRLENIAVRDVQTIESWREMGKEYSTVRITANLLDFTVDENSGQVVSGSKTTPVKFEEYWTFVREQSSPWKLSAIQQN